jgi:AcrR family transcriptional regulator
VTAAEARPEVASLSAKQSERRQRVIDAAMALAEEGGYDAVQMRDVAARADVALGTVYRYFSSKDQMLAAAFAEWAAELEGRLRRRPLQGTTRAERVTDFLRRATRNLERRPRLAGALVTSVAAPDPTAAPDQRRMASWMTRILAEALDGLPSEEQQGIREVACHLLLDLREDT